MKVTKANGCDDSARNFYGAAGTTAGYQHLRDSYIALSRYQDDEWRRHNSSLTMSRLGLKTLFEIVHEVIILQLKMLIYLLKGAGPDDVNTLRQSDLLST